MLLQLRWFGYKGVVFPFRSLLAPLFNVSITLFIDGFFWDGLGLVSVLVSGVSHLGE